MIDVMILDRKCAITDGLGAVVSAEPDIHLVAHVECGHEALYRAHELVPHVAVVEPEVLNGSSMHFLSSLGRHCPQTQALFFSNRRESEHAPYAIGAGASGFLSKQRSTAELLRALRTVARGKIYLPAEVANQVAIRSLRKEEPGALHTRLTLREYDIFQGLAVGRSINELAEALSISPKTVSTHKARIMDKLQVRSLSALVHYAVEYELI